VLKYDDEKEKFVQRLVADQQAIDAKALEARQKEAARAKGQRRPDYHRS
jgi:hypothetical protein